jgi:ribosome-associated translation inhibitor RaiA
MQFQFNSDNRITGDMAVKERVETLVRGRLERVSDRLTRVEVHVADVNGPRQGDDIRCAIEIRPEGMKPISATDEAASVEAAVASATDKVLSAYDRQIGKQTTRKGH